MSEFFDPYNADRPLMMKCGCGRDHTRADHQAAARADEATAALRARSDTADFEAYSREYYGTDEASLVEQLGLPVAVVPGSAHNLKITTPEDLIWAEAILAQRGSGT